MNGNEDCENSFSKNSHSVIASFMDTRQPILCFSLLFFTTATKNTHIFLILRMNKIEMFCCYQSTLFNESVPYVVPVPLDKSVCSLWIHGDISAGSSAEDWTVWEIDPGMSWQHTSSTHHKPEMRLDTEKHQHRKWHSPFLMRVWHQHHDIMNQVRWWQQTT